MFSSSATCSKCKIVKPVTDFSVNKQLKSGHDKRCKKCVSNLGIQLRKNATSEKDKREILRNLDKYIDIFEPDFTNPNWQGGKVKFTIFKREKEDKFSASIKYINGLNQEKSRTKLVKTYDEGIQFIKDICMTHNVNRDNMYKIVTHNDKQYIIVQLSKGYVTLFNISHLDFIRKIKLCAVRTSGKEKRHYCIGFGKSLQAYIHNILSDFDFVDHYDGYPLDNRNSNLSLSNPKENNKNRTPISHKRIGFDVGDNYVAEIKYTENIGEGYVTKFDTKSFPKTKDGIECAKQWLNDREYDINRMVKLHEKRDTELGKEFEYIMTNYADNFKWCDGDDTVLSTDKIEKKHTLITNEEEKVKLIFIDDLSSEDEHQAPLQQPKDEVKNHCIILPKDKKYELFKHIDPDFSFSKYSTIDFDQRTLQEIPFNDVTYRFCARCGTWKDRVKNFGNGKRVIYCKQCQKSKRDDEADLRKDWKAKNKEHIKEYNKKYREANKLF